MREFFIAYNSDGVEVFRGCLPEGQMVLQTPPEGGRIEQVTREQYLQRQNTDG